MSGHILQHLGNSHATHIHAGGRRATSLLVPLVAPLKGERILEVGCGTGGTLIEMATTSKATFHGYDSAPIMIRKAQKRVRWSGLSHRVKVELLPTKNIFPAADHFFDKVYVESVIAIQEGTDFTALLREIRRILKPKGTLVLNETIWLDTTPRARAQEINAHCKKAFGIIQANDEYTHSEDWKRALEELGFCVELNTSLPNLEVLPRQNKRFLAQLPSKAFTISGKIKGVFTPVLRKEWKEYRTKMHALMVGPPLMEGRILKAHLAQEPKEHE